MIYNPAEWTRNEGEIYYYMLLAQSTVQLGSSKNTIKAEKYDRFM